MVRSQMLNFDNQSTQTSSEFEDYLIQMKGTIFSNCYTPAPDTPRSMGCFYSGKYPKNNGCDSRVKWPKYYLNNKTPNLFNYLHKKNFNITTCIRKSRINVGLLPPNFDYDSKNYHTINSLIEQKDKILNKKNSLIFLDFPDYHMAVDDFSADVKAHNYGLKKLNNSIQFFFSKFDFDDFDEIFLFSDHGCKFSNDKEKIYKNIDDKRSKVLMFHRSKAQESFEINNKLCSILDVFPTLYEKIENKINHKFEGINLFSTLEKEIVIEDCTSFIPKLKQINNLWAIRTKNEFYIFYNNKIYNKNLKNLVYKNLEKKSLLSEKFEKLLISNTKSWHSVKKHTEIFRFYKIMKVVNRKYSDGTERPGRLFKFYFKIISLLKKALIRFFILKNKPD